MQLAVQLAAQLIVQLAMRLAVQRAVQVKTYPLWYKDYMRKRAKFNEMFEQRRLVLGGVHTAAKLPRDR